MRSIKAFARRGRLAALAAMAALVAVPAAAQIQTVDPNQTLQTDAAPPPAEAPGDPAPYAAAPAAPPATAVDAAPAWADPATPSGASAAPTEAATANTTYKKDDLIGAAEGVFGKGAEGVARMIEDLLKKQGEPNAYIVGREAGGALFVGARYGSGTMYHKVEGQRPVYWTGPSIGLDVGANAGSTFILVYNLYDTEQLYERYPAAEGAAYVVGGLNASYLRKGNVVLIPIRMGAGLRLGVNAGYMKFSNTQRWLPF